MAEDREGLQGHERIIQDPEAIKRDAREGMARTIDRYIAANPITKEDASALERINSKIPEGRIKEIHGMATDIFKVPLGIAGKAAEILKINPVLRAVAFLPEMGIRLGIKGVRRAGERIVESAPMRFAIGSVEGILNGILGPKQESPLVRSGPVSAENARQVLVGMARPETGKQERRKMT